MAGGGAPPGLTWFPSHTAFAVRVNGSRHPPCPWGRGSGEGAAPAWLFCTRCPARGPGHRLPGEVLAQASPSGGCRGRRSFAAGAAQPLSWAGVEAEEFIAALPRLPPSCLPKAQLHHATLPPALPAARGLSAHGEFHFLSLGSPRWCTRLQSPGTQSPAPIGCLGAWQGSALQPRRSQCPCPGSEGARGLALPHFPSLGPHWQSES